MSDEKAKGSIEDALMRELRFGGLDKDNLKELVGIAAGLHKAGLNRIKAFPKGIPPVVDSIGVTGVLDAAKLAEALNILLTKTPRLAGVELFPLGIPFPEVFEVHVVLGAPVEAGVANHARAAAP
jgi:hypothetical protein